MMAPILKWGLVAGGAAGVGYLLLKAFKGGRAPLVGPTLVMGDSIAVGVGDALAENPNIQVQTKAIIGECAECTKDRVAERMEDVSFFDGATNEFLPVKNIVLSTGTNSIGRDTVYGIVEDISDIVHGLRDEGYRVIILGPPPAMNYAGFNEEQMSEFLDLTVAIEQGFRDVISLWDLLGDGEGLFDEQYDQPDQLHPSRAGYRRIAQAILEGERR